MFNRRVDIQKTKTQWATQNFIILRKCVYIRGAQIQVDISRPKMEVPDTNKLNFLINCWYENI